MNFGRYLLTAFIAAIASSVLLVVVRGVPDWVAAYESGDPKFLAGAISTALMSVILGAIGLFIVGGLFWKLIDIVYLQASTKPRGAGIYMVSGVFMLAVFYLGLAFLYSAGSEGYDASTLGASVLPILLAGMTWGAVFWRARPLLNKVGEVEEGAFS